MKIKEVDGRERGGRGKEGMGEDNRYMKRGRGRQREQIRVKRKRGSTNNCRCH